MDEPPHPTVHGTGVCQVKLEL